MAIEISCPHCRTRFRVADEVRGKKVRCKSCQEAFFARDIDDREDDDEARIQATPSPRSAASPAARRRRDDDYDDRDDHDDPRRDDREDDYEDDRANRRRRKPERERPVRAAGGHSTGLLLGGVAVLLLVGVVGIVGGIIYFSSSSPQNAGNPNAGLVPVGQNPLIPDGGNPGGVVPPVIGAPPVPAGGPAVVGAAGAKLRYRWQGGPQVYAVKIEIEHDKYFETHQGNCVIRPQVMAARAGGNNEPRKATGTGFVVNANGYLITCAHVVEDATKVEVALGGRTYQASVLALDHNNDLAVLQITARGLPTLSLADSDKAEVGMEVRALGFPLSSVLGDNIKATRGTLSGVNQKDNRKVFQVDAAINPGNSGGPLVSETGEVFGVNSSKLAGSAVSNVGFAAPSNEAKRLLASKNITPASGGWDGKLDGPTLVKRVSAATALITVTLGAVVEGDSFRLSTSGSLGKSERGKQGVILMPGPPSFPAFRSPAQMEIDSTGQVLKMSGGIPLPALLGELAQFVIEPLPPDNRPMWELTSTCTITEGSGGRFGGMFPRPPRFGGPRFGPPGFPGAPGDDEGGKKREASERSTYTRGATVGDIVTINKHYELKCAADGSSPGFHLVGDSQYSFDTKNGVPRGVAFNGSITITRGGSTQKLPITVSYTQVEGEAREKILNPPPPPPPPPTKPVTEADLPQLLAEAKNTDRFKAFQRRAAIDKLAQMKVIEAKRGEVVATLVPMLSENDDFLRRSTLKALAVWGTKESGSAILPLLESPSVFVRMDAMDAIAKLKDERGIDPLVKRLSVFQDRSHASKALRQYGATAQKAVIGQLSHMDWGVRMEVCQILKEIGTAESKPALEMATKDSNPLVARIAKEALAAIGSRK